MSVFGESVQAADYSIGHLLSVFAGILRQRDIQALAIQNEAGQFTQMEVQFVSFLSQNSIQGGISNDSEPQRVKADAWSSQKVESQNRSTPLEPLKISGKLSRSLNRSGVKERPLVKSMIREKAQNMVKLPQELRMPPSDVQVKLRRFYTVRKAEQSRLEEERLSLLLQQERTKQKHQKLNKGLRSFTFDYTGKMIHLMPNQKQGQLVAQLTAKVNRKTCVIKKADRKRTDTEIVDMLLYEPTSRKNRKLSTQPRQDREHLSSPVYSITPQFETLNPPDKDLLRLKLSQFKSLYRKQTMDQHLLFATESSPKNISRFPTVATITELTSQQVCRKSNRGDKLPTQGRVRYDQHLPLDKVIVNDLLYRSLIE